LFNYRSYKAGYFLKTVYGVYASFMAAQLSNLTFALLRGLTQPLDLDKERAARTPEEMAAEATELRQLFQ
jgi:hypothetical protein